MFTGIVAAIGRITRIAPMEGGLRLRIDAPTLDMASVAEGDSIAVNGVCLTAIEPDKQGFHADVSQETLACTVGLRGAGEVNLEKSLRLADPLGGHLVSGHVDGVGEVALFEPVGENRLLRVRLPEPLIRYVARKGSVALEGVSLTVNAVDGLEFEVNLIPHTLAVTTLRHLRAGSRINVEVDMLARYVERLLGASRDVQGL